MNSMAESVDVPPTATMSDLAGAVDNAPASFAPSLAAQANQANHEPVPPIGDQSNRLPQPACLDEEVQKVRSSRGRFCCFLMILLVLLPAALLSNLLLSRPPSNPAVRLEQPRQLLAAVNWATCDMALRSDLLCKTAWAPLDMDVSSLAQSAVESLAIKTNTTEHALWPHVLTAATRIGHAGLMAQHLACRGQGLVCEQVSTACGAWVCPRARRGLCLGPSQRGCRRLRRACSEHRISGGEAELSGSGSAPGGVGPPAHWVSPPVGWSPMASQEVSAEAKTQQAAGSASKRKSSPAVRGAHPWLAELWMGSGVHTCQAGGGGGGGQKSRDLDSDKVGGGDGSDGGDVEEKEADDDDDDGWGTVQFGLNVLNDGWCDCADGSDEPGTSACAGRGGRFWCAPVTDGHPAAAGGSSPAFGEWLDTSLVDDGRCDCCDCSDEADPSVGVSTPPACAQGQVSTLGVAEDWGEEAVVEKKKKKKEKKSGKARSGEDAARGSGRMSTALAAAVVEVVRASRRDADETYRRLVLDYRQMGALLQRRPTSAAEYHQLQRIHANYQSLALALTHGFAEPEAVQEAASSILGGWDRSMGSEVAAAAAAAPPNWFDSAETENADASPPSNAPMADALADGTDAASERESHVDADAASPAAPTVPVAPAASTTHHPQQYISLLGDCVGATLCPGGCSSHSSSYYWQVCPFSHILQQASEDDQRPTLVGTFLGWNSTRLPSLVAPDASLAGPRPVWEYGEGEACWEGPARSARVELRCGASTTLIAVEEDGKCRYSMVLRTPYACRVPWTEEEQQAERAAREAREAKERSEAAAAAVAADEVTARDGRRGDADDKSAKAAEAEATAGGGTSEGQGLEEQAALSAESEAKPRTKGRGKKKVKRRKKQSSRPSDDIDE